MTYFQQLQSYGNNLALTDESGRSLTYRHLASECDALAQRLGNGKKLVFIKCENNLETIIGYLAALRGGHTALMLANDLDDSLRQKLISCYQPNCIWDTELEVLNNEPHSFLHSDVALLLSTSGSTGSPKLVKLTAKNLQANAKSIAEYLKLNADERPITTLPLSYSYGLSVINSHLLTGARILLTSQPVVQREFWDFFRDLKATSFAGVPHTYEMLYRLRLERMDLPSLRYMTQAGGKLSPKLTKHFATIAKNKGARFYTMYGQTEATARISWLPADKVLEKTGSIGIAIPGGELHLENSEGEIVNTEGELIYKGDNVMMGYAESIKDLAKPDELEGVLRTGDIARMDSDGFFYLTGRLKRFIKIFGNRVNLDEIEHDLKASGMQCVCTGEDNRLIIACLENVETVKKHIIELYHFHHRVFEVHKVDYFPITPSGKIQYAELFNWFSGRK
jgi:acyl-CoA synthetase (AMP-forming)/AMP-acid ligase II